MNGKLWWTQPLQRGYEKKSTTFPRQKVLVPTGASLPGKGGFCRRGFPVAGYPQGRDRKVSAQNFRKNVFSFHWKSFLSFLRQAALCWVLTKTRSSRSQLPIMSFKDKTACKDIQATREIHLKIFRLCTGERKWV